MRVFTAPESLSNITGHKIFLAGSIEMGAAEEWQQKAIRLLEVEETQRDWYGSKFSVLNPRREPWDNTINQEFISPAFFQQVTWELQAIDKASVVLFYFDPVTKSPISLMELGYVIGKKKPAVVVCPDGFWRKGNIDIICHTHSVHQAETLEDAVKLI